MKHGNKGARPDNGSEYSPIELGVIWDIPVTEADIIEGRQRRFEFFEHIGDVVNADHILRASIGDINELHITDHESP